MLSKKTKRIITSATLSLTIFLSFLGSSIKEVKAFDKTKAVYEIKDARTYEYTASYNIKIKQKCKYAYGELYVGSISSTAHQLDTTFFRATIDGKNINIFNSNKKSLEEKEEELKNQQLNNTSNKNQVFGIWEQIKGGNYKLHVYVFNITDSFNKNIKISKEFISGNLDYGLYKENDAEDKEYKQFSDKLKEVLKSSYASYDSSDLLKGYKYDDDKKIPYNNTQIKNKTIEITKGCANNMERVQSIYRFVVKHMYYVNLEDNEQVKQYANKGAISALNTGKGVCEDYASLFIAMCREIGIPARYVYGLGSATGRHAWAEFYLPYYGWIVVESTVPGLKTVDELALQYNMMNFIGNDKYGKDLIPAHSVLGYNNEPHTYKWTSDGTIDFKILDSKVTIKGEPIKSVVYNQPFSNYQERIDSVNKLLEIAKNTKKEEDIKEARKLAQTLIDSEERKDILKQLDSIGKNDELQYEIGALVVELENSDVIDSNKFEKLKEMLNNASEEIVEEFKTIYDKIQKRYEIENLIKETEGNLTEENLDKLSNLLDNANIENKYKLSYISKYDRFLNNYTKKVEEQEQAEYQAKVQNVTKAVEKAENSKNQTDVDNARVVVNSLKDTDKSNLNTRLDKIQKDIDDKKTEEEKQAEYAAKVQNATKAVEKAVRTTIYEDYISATNLVSNLQDSEIKIQLWDRLGEVKVDIGRKEEATRLVKLAEEDNTETNYNRALESINRLRDNELKKDLLNRLNKVKTTIDNNKAKEEEKAKNQRALEEAIKVVEQAERENEEKSYSEALVIVNVLEESASKKELLDRLYEVKINIENIKTNKAIELVKYAERYPSITSYNNAKDAVNVIRDGNIKSELLNNLKNVEDRIKKLDKETEKNNP